MKAASEAVSTVIDAGDIVIFESTVYPTVTEEFCGKIIESNSNLKLLKTDDAVSSGFYLGYSPERINPGDKTRRLNDIVKVTSASTPNAANIVDELYSTIVSAGTFKALDIATAEASKVIENTQRDVNIALINELAILFHHMGLDTTEVLKAAKTKWNFLDFSPGLVGGHCIGVDPYYLTHKAAEYNHNPEMVLAARRINDSMAEHISFRIVKLMLGKQISTCGAKVLILGLTFKENCPDLRNSKVFDIIKHLEDLKCDIDVYDPLVGSDQLGVTNSPNMVHDLPENSYDCIVVAVPHNEILQMGFGEIRRSGKQPHVIFDIKSVFDANEVEGRL